MNSSSASRGSVVAHLVITRLDKLSDTSDRSGESDTIDDHLKLYITLSFDLQKPLIPINTGGFSNNLSEPGTKSLELKVDVHDAPLSKMKCILVSLPSKP